MRIVFIVAVLSIAALSARAAVMGIDYGSDFIKVAAPKNNAIDIVLNEQSHRKTHSYIGFRASERYFAEDAKNLAPRFPDNMFTYMNHLVGVPFNDSEVKDWFASAVHQKVRLEEALKPDNASATPLGTIAMRTGSNPEVAYHAETLMGMMFGYLRSMVKKDTGKKLRDAVLTVPAGFNLRQRQALIDSAALSNTNVIATMHVTTAVALQYGLKNQGFGNTTATLMVFDMGATHTDVGVYRFSPPAPRSKKEKVKNAEALGTLTTLAIVSNSKVGGRAFDTCLAELIEERFVKATKLPGVLEGKTLAQRKSVIALMRAGNKAKEILSANKFANVVAEGMAPNKDFPTTITREEFEERCAAVISDTMALVERAAAKAGVEISQLDALELSGGSSRVPKLIDELSRLRGKAVDRTLNTDEAAAIGAAFYGGVLTRRFRVKSFAVNESLFIATPHAKAVSFALSAKTEGEPSNYRALFGQSSRLGQLKAVTVNRTSSFDIVLAYNTTDAIIPDHTVKVTGVTEGLGSVKYYASIPGFENAGALGIETSLNHPNNSHSIRIEFRATESGLVSVETAELRINYVANVTTSVKVNLTDAELEDENRKAIEKATELHRAAEERRLNATKSDNSTAAETPNTTVAETSDEAQNSTDPETELTADDSEARLQKRIKAALKKVKTFKFESQRREELKRTVVKLRTKNVYTFPSPLTRGVKKMLKGILEDFDFADEQRLLLSKAKNDLEGYLIWTKNEGVLDNSELRESGALTEEKVADVQRAATHVSEWLDNDANSSTPREEYEAKLAELKAIVKPILAAGKKEAPVPAANNQTDDDKPSNSSEVDSADQDQAGDAAGDESDGADSDATSDDSSAEL